MIGEKYLEIGIIHGRLVGVITFISLWIYCISKYGFLLGVGLGWLPSGIVSYLISLIVTFLWLPADLLVLATIIYLYNDSHPALVNPPVSRSFDQSLPASSTTTDIPALADQKLSGLEISTLKRQITNCWNIDDLDRNKMMPVEVIIEINPDRTIRTSKIVDERRFAVDANFRAVARSALNALQNPDCNFLNLPPLKYDEWKKIDFTFDPNQN